MAVKADRRPRLVLSGVEGQDQDQGQGGGGNGLLRGGGVGDEDVHAGDYPASPFVWSNCRFDHLETLWHNLAIKRVDGNE